MNSDDALQESNEDRDTFADESERCLAFYNVDPAVHAHVRVRVRTRMFVNVSGALVSGVEIFKSSGEEVRKSRRDKNR